MMKKLFLFLFVVACGLVSCEGPEGPMGPEGPGMNWEVQTFEVTQWQRIEDEDGIYYRYEMTPQLFQNLSFDDREFIYEKGTVMVYMFENAGTNNETQRPLPNISNFDSNDGDRTQVRNFYFNYSTDKVYIYFTYSGDEGDIGPLNNLWFRIVMNW